jgi:ABC-2 type transport system ATP-binding protein
LLDLVGLTPHAGKQLRNYSKGMLQRIGIAQALINDPQLVFLDEPTSGLDPVGRRLVRDIITTQRERGATVFLNSHLLSEVEIICDRVAFIRSGTVIEVRQVSEFAESPKSVVARVRQMPENAAQGLAPWATDIEMNSHCLRFCLKDAEFAPRALQYLVDIGAEVYEFTPQRATLEDRFLEILGMDHGL